MQPPITAKGITHLAKILMGARHEVVQAHPKGAGPSMGWEDGRPERDAEWLKRDRGIIDHHARSPSKVERVRRTGDEFRAVVGDFVARKPGL